MSVKSQKDLVLSTISPFYFSQSLPHDCDGDDDGGNSDDNDGNIGDGDDGDDADNDDGDGGGA